MSGPGSKTEVAIFRRDVCFASVSEPTPPPEFVKTFLGRAADETNKCCDDTILGMRCKLPETRRAHPYYIELANEGANDAQVSLFSRSPCDCFHGGIRLVAHRAHAFPGRYYSVDQSDRYEVELQRHASG